ncbi:MAG: hypothetical protein WDZ84_01440 [Rhodovibrionaceae bacterium]
MAEKVRRLAPKMETLRELFLKSGNLCAYPGCNALMMNSKGVFIGQVCHIKAAEEGGERFNSNMTNDERRAAENLMLMCYPHHQETNDAHEFPVERLKKFKADHEKRFSRADRAILERLTDWTRVDEPSNASSLSRINDVLKWGLSEPERAASAAELGKYIENLRIVPVEVRRFIGAVAQRMYRVRDTRAVASDMHGHMILVRDVHNALKIRKKAILDRAVELDAYKLGGIREIEVEHREMPAVYIRDLKSGWPLWLDVAEFCEIEKEPLNAFTDDMDFSRLD